MTTAIARLDAYQRRHRAAGFPLAVVYKYVDDSGGQLAALITFYGFLAIFPALLLATTILGIVLQGDPGAQQRILDSALAQFPGIGDQLQQPDRLNGGATALVIGGVGAVFGALGVTLAVQNAMNTAWSVPRNDRPNPIKARLRGLLLLLTVGVALIATAGLSTFASQFDGWGVTGRVLLFVLSAVLNAGTFLAAFRIATARALSVRDVAPGAVGAAVIWQLLQSFGTIYVSHVVQGASTTNGVFAIVIGLISFLYLAATAVLLCVEVNVVRVERLYPRALLTPFTDNVDLTEGDRRSYTGKAQAQRSKGFQQILVRFRSSSR